MIRLATEAFDAKAEAGRLDTTGSGALVQFTGLVRSMDEREPVGALILNHHPSMTLTSMVALGDTACSRFDLTALGITHRVGRIAPGEPVVWVGAAARHRRAAFDAVDFVMDHLKGDALFWKQEERMDGTHWIEPTDRDHADRARWTA